MPSVEQLEGIGVLPYACGCVLVCVGVRYIMGAYTHPGKESLWLAEYSGYRAMASFACLNLKKVENTR